MLFSGLFSDIMLVYRFSCCMLFDKAALSMVFRCIACGVTAFLMNFFFASVYRAVDAFVGFK